MAEYWKSLPRKFCDLCKCWFADNKSSVNFHEQGKRHQVNVQKRIQEIQKKSVKEFKKQKQLENEMEKIEKAALAAYKKDLQNMEGAEKPQVDFEIPKKQHNSISEPSLKMKSPNAVEKKKKITIKSEPIEEPSPASPNIWYEALTDEGYKYYWSTETSESRWEPPEEGFISIEEQNKTNETTQEEQQKSPEGSSITIKKEKDDDQDHEDIACSVGPQPKVDPYGQWVTIEKKEPVVYDLQLPEAPENTVEVVIPLYKDQPSLKFKEKVIGQLSDTEPGEVTFKKRKINSALKKNTRRRTDDND